MRKGGEQGAWGHNESEYWQAFPRFAVQSPADWVVSNRPKLGVLRRTALWFDHFNPGAAALLARAIEEVPRESFETGLHGSPVVAQHDRD